MLLTLVLFFLIVLVANAVDPYRSNYETNNQNPDLIHGDIIMTARDKFIQQLPKDIRIKLFVKENGINRWPNNIVPYNIENTYTDAQKKIITDALNEIQQKTCFKFVKRTNQKDYVNIKSADGCNSPLGREGGAQRLSLGTGCVHIHTVQHEMMHAIGIHHEHQRPDRDNFVKVNFANVEPKWRRKIYNSLKRIKYDFLEWFDKVSTNDFNLKGFKYDVNSVMHYRASLENLEK